MCHLSKGYPHNLLIFWKLSVVGLILTISYLSSLTALFFKPFKTRKDALKGQP